jgi:DNA-binding HxlR family transcriptional regulator
VRTYGQYCPVAKAAEVLGDRWTLLIVREMSFGVNRFNELQRCLPGISRSVLTQRLRHMERAGLIERDDMQYCLTEAGRDLKPVLHALGDWAARWAFAAPDPSELDTDLLIRWISRHTSPDAIPRRRVVVRFDFTAPRHRRYWLVLSPSEASVCLHDPGFDTDAVLTSDAKTLYEVYLGRRTLTAATKAGLVTVEGAPAMVRGLPRWFTWSAFAPAVRAAMPA